MPGPWEKYAKAAPQEDGPWVKYAKPATGQSDAYKPLTTEQPAPEPSVASEIGTGIKNLGVGAMKGAGSTANAIGKILLPDAALKAVGMHVPTAEEESHAFSPQGTAQSVGYGLEHAGEWLTPMGAEDKAGELLAEHAPMLGRAAGVLGRIGAQTASGAAINKLQGGGMGTGAVAGAAGGALGELLPLATAPLQERATGKINRVIGAMKSDFKRGANPGEGYFQARLGPSLSLGSIASKAENALEKTGVRIGDVIDAGAGAGTQIPALSAARSMAEPINRWHSVLSGPGGGSVDPVEDLAATFRPSLKEAARKGGYTPRELFDVKKNVARNVAWGDAAQIGPKKVRQQIVGEIGNTLAEHVPELRDLNSTYQNLSKLSERTMDRAITGRPTLSGVGKTLAKTGIAGAGLLDKGLTGGVLGLIPALYDSVPLQTGIASGLYYGGRALGRIGPLAGHLGPATVLPFTRTVRQ